MDQQLAAAKEDLRSIMAKKRKAETKHATWPDWLLPAESRVRMCQHLWDPDKSFFAFGLVTSDFNFTKFARGLADL